MVNDSSRGGEFAMQHIQKYLVGCQMADVLLVVFGMQANCQSFIDNWSALGRLFGSLLNVEVE